MNKGFNSNFNPRLSVLKCNVDSVFIICIQMAEVVLVTFKRGIHIYVYISHDILKAKKKKSKMLNSTKKKMY